MENISKGSCEFAEAKMSIISDPPDHVEPPKEVDMNTLNPHQRRALRMKMLGDLLDLRPEQEGIDIREMRREAVDSVQKDKSRQFAQTMIKDTVLGRRPPLKAVVHTVMGLNGLARLKDRTMKFKRRNAIQPAAPGMQIIPANAGTKIVNYEGIEQ